MNMTFIKMALAAGILASVSACNLVDKGGSEIGGIGCGWSSGTPGTPEYKRCRTKGAHEGVLPTRGIGGAIGQ